MSPHLPFLPWPPSYGLLVATGFVVALLLLRRLAPMAGVDRGVVEDVVVWACLWGLLGAKLALVVLDPMGYAREPWGLVTEGGVFYGGLVAAALSVLYQCWRRGVDPHAVGDACAPALAVGHAFGRLGCFLAGCCWGRPSDAAWAVRFTDPEALCVRTAPDMAGVAVHPVQLYEAAANLALAGAAFWLLRRRRFTGGAWWPYVAGYGLMRTGLETFRGDERGTWMSGSLSTSQGIGLAASVVALAVWAWRARAAREPAHVARPGTEATEPGPPPAP
jgi:phosphatidylglycerol:prolipoprotein diacylglycerol transferase